MPLPKYRIHADSYARDIAEGLRKDGWPAKLSGAEARIIAGRYNVRVPFDVLTTHSLAEVSQIIAEDIADRVNV